jgi:GDP-L-fucose synthase
VKKILVTGGSGMLGSSIISNLKRHNVITLSPSRQELNLENWIDTLQYIEYHQPDLIYHCAAKVAGIKSNIDGGSSFLTVNSNIDHNLLFAARTVKTPKLFYIASSCMYPANQDYALAESDLLTGQLEPTNASYALAKILGTKLTEGIAEQEGLNWVSIISSNLFGPEDNFLPESSHLLASIIQKIDLAIRRGDKSIEVWGTGKVRREFTYVKDLAHWLADIGVTDVLLPRILNVGRGEDFTVDEWYELTMSVFGVSLSLNHNLNQPDGNTRKLMDSSIARNYGWKAETQLELSLRETIDWYRNATWP